MKRFFKLFTLIMCIFIISIKGVKAETVNVSQQFVDNVWSFHYRNGSVWTFGNLPYNYANGKLVYCIQPDARITTSTYNVYSDFSLSGYSEDARKRMELITYYGYGYPGHNSLKYYMATQELLWLLSNDESIKWTTGNTDDTPMIDVSQEKNEINRLISKHNVLPSFINETKEGKTGLFTEFIDSNNVIKDYDIITNDLGYSISENRVVFLPKRLGTFTVNFRRKNNSTNFGGYIYDDFSIRTQTLASFGIPTSPQGKVTVKVNEIGISIYKKDFETKELIKDSGIKVKIKNKDTNQYVGDEYEFKNGRVYVYLPVGKYVVEEIGTVEPYTINKDNLEFEVKEGSYPFDVDFYNKKATGKINIIKENEEKQKLSDVEFEVYDENNNLVDTLKTTNGNSLSKELPLGKYIVKETKGLYGYEKDNNEYEVDLTYKDQNESIVIKDLKIVNKKIKCLITYITVSGKEKIDAEFNIYSKDGTLIYTGKTMNGEAKINLPYGDYIIKEISVPNEYILNNKEISFSVNDKICESTMSVNNEKVTMPITSKESNLAYLIMILINSVGYAFIKKYN